MWYYWLLTDIQEDVLCYGGEGGKVHFYNITDNSPVCTCDTETNR